MNLKVGHASRLPPAAKPTGMLALTRSLGRRDACPTLLATRFRGSWREVGVGGILTLTLSHSAGEREQPLFVAHKSGIRGATASPRFAL